jgi:hypothetical protein
MIIDMSYVYVAMILDTEAPAHHAFPTVNLSTTYEDAKDYLEGEFETIAYEGGQWDGESELRYVYDRDESQIIEIYCGNRKLYDYYSCNETVYYKCQSNPIYDSEGNWMHVVV